MKNYLGTEEQEETIPPKKVTKDICSTTSEVKMIVVWLESFEDHNHFPIGNH